MEKKSNNNSVIIIVVVSVLVLGICFICCGLPTIASIFNPTPTTTVSRVESSPVNTPEATTPAAPKKQLVEEWKLVKEFSGTGSKKTEPFKITGKRYKVSWTAKEYITIFSYPVDGSIFGADTVTVGATENGDSIIYKDGEFYLDVSTLGTKWSIKVEELVEKEV